MGQERGHPGQGEAGGGGGTGRYAVCPEVALEDFETGTLALLCEQMRLVRLNRTAREVVAHLDGQRSARQVAEAMARAYGQPLEPVLADVLALLANLEAEGVVRREGSKAERRCDDPLPGQS